MSGNRLRILVLGSALMVVTPAFAQHIAWQQRIEVEVPAGVGLKTITPSARDGASNLAVAVVTYVTFEDRYQYRVIATDPSDGNLRWSHDFGPACAYDGISQASTATLADGDIAVVVQGQDRVTNFRHACVVRLRATDGGLVWSRVEHAADGHVGIYAMSARAGGDLLLAGRHGALARVQAWDATSGATRWQRDIGESGSSLQAVDMADGPGGLGVLHVRVISGTTVSSRLVGLDLDDGSTTWSRIGCSSGAVFYVDGQQGQSRLRLFDDGTLVQIFECSVGSASSTWVSRHVAASGNVVWQRELQQTWADAIIRDDRDVLLSGSLLLDGANAGLARLSGTDGATLWEGPRDGTWFRMAQAGGRVFILGIELDVSGYVTSLQVAAHDLASGVRLVHQQVTQLPNRMLADHVHFGAFDDGDVIVAAMSGDNRSAGSRLAATRFQPGLANADWLATIPVMGAHPFQAQRPYATGTQVAGTAKGVPGVVVSGDGLKDSGDVYPRAVKLDSRDGHRLWAWQPDARRNGSISSTLATGEGDIIIAGDEGSGASRLLLERLDGATGTVGWKFVATTSSPALEAALLHDGSIVAVIDDGTGTRLARHSSANGMRSWEAVIPDGYSSERGDHRVVTHADGSITVAGRHQSATAGSGVQVVRFRGSDGGLLWRRLLPNAPIAGERYVGLLALADGDVVVRTPGELWRVDGGNGEVEWTSVEPFTVNAMASVAGDIVVAGYSGGRAIARLRGSDGETLWSRVLPVVDPLHPEEALTALSLGGDGQMLVSGGDGFFGTSAAALDPLDGDVLWQVSAATDPKNAGGESMAGIHYWPVAILQMQDGNVFFGGSQRPYPETWTLTKVTGGFADGIFADGFQ